MSGKKSAVARHGPVRGIDWKAVATPQGRLKENERRHQKEVSSRVNTPDAIKRIREAL